MDIPVRRNMIQAAIRVLSAKDVVKSVKKFEKLYGPVFRDAHAAAYEFQGKGCLAVVEDMIDASISAKFGWKTMDAIRAECFAKLKADMA